MRVKKADANQAELVRQIRKIPGVSVAHTHTVGNGFVDLVLGHRGVNYLAEVKNPNLPPSARKLTPDEKTFFDTWTGQKAVVHTIDDVLEMLGLNLLN